MTLHGSSRPRRLLIVRAGWVLVTTAVVLVGAWLYQVSRSPVYTSHSTVVLESVMAPRTRPLAPAMGTEKQVAVSGVVLARAAGPLGTDEHELSRRVSVTVPPDANVLDIRCTAGQAKLAQECAQKVADSYVAYRNDPSSASPAGGRIASPLRASVVTAAALPTGPTRVSVAVLLGLGLVAGLSLGVVTAYLRDMHDDRLRDAHDLANRSGLPVLPLVSREADADALRALQGQLDALARGVHGRTVLVAPVGPERNGAHVAAELAAAFARSGSSVVLVDGDLRVPGLPRHLVLPAFEPGNPGLTGLLHGLAQPDEVLQETTVTGLSVVTAGPVDEDAADLMVPERLAAALDELRTADLVVVKGAPVLATADTVALASAVDVCLLLAEIGRTKRRAVRRAVAALPHRPDRLVAAVPLGTAGSPAPVARPKVVKPSPDAPLPSPTASGNGAHVPQGDPSGRTLVGAGRDEDEASLPSFDEVISGEATARGGQRAPSGEPRHARVSPYRDQRAEEADAGGGPAPERDRASAEDAAGARRA